MRPAELHPECLPISIPADDPFFSQFGQTCMDFVRSSTAPKLDCRLGYREQVSQHKTTSLVLFLHKTYLWKFDCVHFPAER